MLLHHSKIYSRADSCVHKFSSSTTGTGAIYSQFSRLSTSRLSGRALVVASILVPVTRTAELSMGNSSAKNSFSFILKRLTTEDLDAADQEFWDQLWKTPLTVEVPQLFDAARKL